MQPIITQSRHHLPNTKQPLVDIDTLLEHVTMISSFADTLRPSQVNQIQFRSSLIVAVLHITINRVNSVRPGTARILFRFADVSPPATHSKKPLRLVRAAHPLFTHLLQREPLYGERRGTPLVQQIEHVLVVDFDERY